LSTPYERIYTGFMTRQMTITEVKAKLLSVMDDVENGEEIEITRHGLTVARLVPARRHSDLRGLHLGKVKINVPDEELYSTGVIWEAQ
jgi:prevent-host-death family protein